MRRMVRSGKRMRRILHTGSGSRRGLAVAGLLAAAATPVMFTAGSSAAPAPVGQGFTVTSSDISHILRQIKIAEAHIAKNNEPGWLSTHGICDALVGTGPNQVATPLVADGLRTVDGSCNNLIHGQEKFGASGETFPRLTTPNFRDAEASPPDFFGPGSGTIPSSSYKQKKGFVFDSQPRLISNLIVDQTATNPAAVSAAGQPVRTQGNEGVVSCVAANEVQTLSGTPSADFSLEFEGQRTASLAPNATADDVRSALVALSNVGPADVGVTGGPLPDAITIAFKGALKAKNVAQITVVPGTSAVSGVTVTTATRDRTSILSRTKSRTSTALRAPHTPSSSTERRPQRSHRTPTPRQSKRRSRRSATSATPMSPSPALRARSSSPSRVGSPRRTWRSSRSSPARRRSPT